MDNGIVPGCEFGVCNPERFAPTHGSWIRRELYLTLNGLYPQTSIIPAGQASVGELPQFALFSSSRYTMTMKLEGMTIRSGDNDLIESLGSCNDTLIVCASSLNSIVTSVNNLTIRNPQECVEEHVDLYGYLGEAKFNINQTRTYRTSGNVKNAKPMIIGDPTRECIFSVVSGSKISPYYTGSPFDLKDVTIVIKISIDYTKHDFNVAEETGAHSRLPQPTCYLCMNSIVTQNNNKNWQNRNQFNYPNGMPQMYNIDMINSIDMDNNIDMTNNTNNSRVPGTDFIGSITPGVSQVYTRRNCPLYVIIMIVVSGFALYLSIYIYYWMDSK